ncbi:MAG: hypothetical protein C0625_09670 [Arcobacter sp.]|nr:MAG: hypothetical protein C0625_09670 [Arcobacter sp.]
MSILSRKEKTYGVLHTENYFSFIGFCKKVNSEEIQNIDIYLDDQLIDTILADKKLEKIDDIYDIEGFGFKYNLNEKDIGSKSTISFKNHITQENLQNSPYELMDKTSQGFNEAIFLHSLSQANNDNKIKDIFCPNTIGFLATDINLNDSSFMNFIHDLKVRFPSIKFVGFTYESIPRTTYDIHIEQINSLIELVSKCSIFISNRYLNYDHKILLLEKVLVKSDFVCPIIFDERLSSMNLESFESLIKSAPYDPVCDDYLKLGLSQNHNRSAIKTVYKEILHINTDTLNFKEMYVHQYYGDIIESILNSKDSRLIFNKIWKLYVKNIFN